MKRVKRLLAMLLAAIMVINEAPIGAFAAEAESNDSVVVIAGSDFQDPADGKDTSAPSSAANVSAILTQVKKNHPTVDGLIFCGDYDKDLPSGNVQNSVNSLKSAVSGSFGMSQSSIDWFLVQGNHDQVTQGTNGLTGPGAHDTDDYGVFIIDEDDYQWSSGVNATKIQQTAANLKSYLESKVKAGYSKPIFVASHVPLHFSPRTQEGDGKYAKYIFDELQAGGAAGLTIFFLYGHDHSQGWDNYMGGAAVYLPVGHDINIAQTGSGTKYDTYQLKFTYMNAGFVGYYADWEPETDANNTDSGVDKTKTMTVFEISDDKVTVERYDANGVHKLKSEGKKNVKHTTRTQCTLMTDTLSSPQVVKLSAGGTEEPPVTPDDTTYTGTYKYAESAAAGEEYLLVSNGYALQNKNGNAAAVKVAENADGTISVDKAAEEASLMWKLETSAFTDSGIFNISNSNLYIGRASGDDEQAMSLLNTNNTYYTAWSYVDGSALKQISGADSTYTFYAYNRAGAFYVNHEEDIQNDKIDSTMKLYEKVETEDLAEKVFTDDSTDISVRTPSGSAMTVRQLSSSKTYFGISDYVLYDISIAGFNTGDTATVSIPLPDGFDKPAVYHIDEDDASVLTPMTIESVENGKVIFKTTHFSTYMVGNVEVDIDSWVKVEIPGETKHVYTLDTNGIDAGSEYLIVAGQSANCLTWSGESTFTPKPVTISSNKITLDTTAYNLKFTRVDNNTYTLTNGGNYFRVRKSGSSYSFRMNSNDSNCNWTVTHNGSGVYSIVNTGTNRGISLSDSSITTNNGNSNKRLFKYTPETTTAETYYLGMSGDASYTFSTTIFADKTELETYLKEQITVCRADDTNGTNIKKLDYTLTPNKTVTPKQAGTVTYTVSYDGHTVGTFNVTFVARSITGVSLVDNIGSVYRGAKSNANTGAKLRVAYSDGTSEDVDIALNMLTGTYDRNTEGMYPGLTVTYGGKTASGFTLEVKPNPKENDYPEYPDEGSVIVNKTGKGIDFNSTGVAEIELSAKGIPAKKGVDVIVMVDTSSSMKYGAKDGTATAASGSQRIDFLRNSLTAMLKKFAEVNEDGTAPDVRLALADFNGYTENNGWKHTGGKSYETQDRDNLGKIFTGDKSVGAGAFEQVGNYTDTKIATLVKNVQAQSGTNYDYAFEVIYRLATAIKAENDANNEDRELYVIFMSDGCPYQYNYFQGNSGNTNSVGTKWNNIMNGEYATADDLPAISNNNYVTYPYFYNAATGNTHRMADAIKGDPTKTFEIISTNTSLYGATPVAGRNYMYTVNGLGVTMYSIGFCIYKDNNIQASTISKVIKSIASDEDHYFNVQGDENDAQVQADLDDAFTQISSDIRKAATNASFDDTMGEDYDIQLAKVDYQVKDSGGNVTNKSITPKITVKAYNVHKRSEYLAGTISEDKIGTRTNDEPEILETVFFSDDGTQAFIEGLVGGSNILIDGVIRAHTFYYNTTDEEKTVNGITIAPESFHWIIGDIGEKEVALGYYVYLTGSIEGKRPAGYYPTNESAVLNYTNWLGHKAYKDTVSPVMPWGAATVSYAFYLVDENGNVINSAGQQASSFANRVALTQPAVFRTIYLNSGADLSAQLLASGVVPEGFDLYDPTAAYNVQIASNEINGGWTITKDSSVNKASTYVTNYDLSNSTAFSNSLTMGNPDYSYTSTVVWFAVKTQIKCVPDIVVVDFGLPVDIDVMANDMFGNFGTLSMVVNVSDVKDLVNGSSPRHAEPVARTDMDLRFGVVSQVAGSSKITYTPTNMQMYDVETFAYEVKYENPDVPGLNGYYYGTVTVVPATLIYYEDRNEAASFATFTGDWTDVDTTGKTNKGQMKKQAQDRPGFYNFSSVDANNIYGYDPVYGDCTEFSLDSAKKTTVSSKEKGSWPTATFTFTGTGFDLISVTSRDTGVIKVDIYKTGEVTTKDGKLVVNAVNDTLVKSWAVDTFYGYKPTTANGYIKSTWTYDGKLWHITREPVTEAGESQSFPSNPAAGASVVVYDKNYTWEVTAEGDSSALYQIPVIKCYNQLDYAQYKVVITPTYSTLFQRNKGKDSYDYYFDAVRIYDPAYMSEAAEKVYKEDNEAFPQYIEVRKNLLDQEDFDTFGDSETPIIGAVFIDGFSTTGGISEYTDFGPNNEVYLNPGQSIAFKIDVDDRTKLASVQLGAKCVNGAAKCYIRSYDSISKMVAEYTKELNTATDMFYDVTKYITWENDKTSNSVVLTNTGDSILSITQIKLTFNEDPTPAQAPARLMMSRSTAMLLTSTLNQEYVDAHTEEAAPAEEETPAEIFAPAKFKLSVKKDSLKKGQKVDLTLVTSGDVDSVLINGQTVQSAKVDKKTGEKTWSLKFTAEEAGVLVISAVGFNSDGIASEPVETTVTVK